MIYFAATRFTTETYEENSVYKDKHLMNCGCIYGSCTRINSKYPPFSSFFVVEMNNTTNQVLGIGLIQNLLVIKKHHKIYSNGHYNRYTYIGRHHLSREELVDYDETLLKSLEDILFRGKTNCKRHIGITTVSPVVCNKWGKNILHFKLSVRNMFVAKYNGGRREKEHDEEKEGEQEVNNKTDKI